jgi:transcriptional regulator
MVAPSAFRVADETAAFDFVARTGFATLVTIDDGRPLASHLPMLVDRRRRVLRGHLARANPQAGLIGGRRHLAVFLGANAYVSPDWYGGPNEVPTWNYQAAHIEGTGRVVGDPQDVDAFLSDLSDHHEARRSDLSEGKFWKMSKLDAARLPKLRAGIVAFEIAVEQIDFLAKLSQNKSVADISAVARKLAAGGDAERAVAAAMAAANGMRP